MKAIYELMKELISRIETSQEMLEKDPDSEYIKGRMDMAKTILASCDRLTD